MMRHILLTIAICALTFTQQAQSFCFSGTNYHSGGANPWAVTTADFNNDGILDLAVANFAPGNNVAVSIGNGDGTFQSPTNFFTGDATSGVTAGDFNNDGKLDIAASNYTDDSVAVLLGNGLGNFGSRTCYLVGSAPYNVITADINNDGKLDLMTPNSNSSNVSVLIGNGNGTFQTANNFLTDPGPYSLICNDFTSDGKPDLAVSTGNFGISILTGNGNGSFSAPVNFVTSGNASNSIVSADFNGDGKADLATTNMFTNDVSVLIGNGNGSFGTATNYVVNSTPYSLCTADFNNDGKYDIAVANYNSNNVSLLKGNGNGTFTSATTLTGSFQPAYIIESDLNNDTKPDLISVGGGSAYINLNTRPSAFISGNSPVCIGYSNTLTATGAGDYFWSANTGGFIGDVVSVYPTSATTYTVYASNFGCNDTVQATITLSPVIPAAPEICSISVDSISQNNVIVWEKTLYGIADTFFVYRDTANNNYALIAAIPYDSLSSFTDTVRTLYSANGDPNASSWRYKISYKDTCGNRSPKSPYHQTMFFQNSAGNFSWNHYQIEGQSMPVPSLSNYLFKRDDFATGTWATIQTLSASSLAYTDPNYFIYAGTANWRVETSWTIQCTPSYRVSTDNSHLFSIVNTSRSNIKNQIAPTTGLVEENTFSISVYPNPAKDEIFINTGKTNGNAVVEICDVTGRVVQRVSENKQVIAVNTSAIANGVYFVSVLQNGKREVAKIVIEK